MRLQIPAEIFRHAGPMASAERGMISPGGGPHSDSQVSVALYSMQ